MLPPDRFETLRAATSCFVDSSYISKVDSDVNCGFFSVLPAIRPHARPFSRVRVSEGVICAGRVE
jgi:hypothetical protein